MRSRGLTYLVARVSLGDKRTPRYANRSLTFFISIFDLCGVVWCVLLVMHSFFFCFCSRSLFVGMSRKPASARRRSELEALKRRLQELENPDFVGQLVQYTNCPWQASSRAEESLLKLPWSDCIRSGIYGADDALWTPGHQTAHAGACVSLRALCEALRQTLRRPPPTKKARTMSSYLRDTMGNQGLHMILVHNGIVDSRYKCNVIEFILLIARLWLTPSGAADVWHTESTEQTAAFLTDVKSEDWVTTALAQKITDQLEAAPPTTWLIDAILVPMVPPLAPQQANAIGHLPWHKTVLDGTYTMATPLVSIAPVTLETVWQQFCATGAPPVRESLTRSRKTHKLLRELGLFQKNIRLMPIVTTIVQLVARIQPSEPSEPSEGKPDRSSWWTSEEIPTSSSTWLPGTKVVTFDDPTSRRIKRVKAAVADLTHGGTSVSK